MLCGVVHWTVLCYHPYLVSMLFGDLLSLRLVTFLTIFFILVHVTFLQQMHAWAEVCHYHRAAGLPSQASSVDVCSIGWRTIDQTNSNTPMHTNCISNSATLCNNCISLLSSSSKFIHIATPQRERVQHNL